MNIFSTKCRDNMNGREKCRLINQIRQKLAENNGIDFIIPDCTFKGDCSGICEKSESELNYLEKELEKIQNRGEKLNIKGIFTLDEEPEPENTEEEIINIQEKIEEIRKIPELNDLHPRFLDMLL